MWQALTSPFWVGRIVGVVGAVTLASAILPDIRSRTQIINEIVPAVFPAAATTGAAALGLVLIVLSRALRRGKFRAWLLATVLSLITAVMGINGPIAFIDGQDSSRSAVALVVLGASVVLLALLVGLQPADGPHPLTGDEESALREALQGWGGIDSLSYFSLEGRSMRMVRQAVSRCSRAGLTVTCHRIADLDDATLTAIRAKAEHWRDGAVERGFSMALGRFGDPADGRSVVVLSTDAEGQVAGLMADASDLGVRRVSLNFAVFRSVFARGERLGAGPVLRLWRSVLLAASRFWQIESLYRANAKYQPEWVPRFVCFLSSADLPRVSVAALRAEAFIVAPKWLQRFARA